MLFIFVKKNRMLFTLLRIKKSDDFQLKQNDAQKASYASRVPFLVSIFKSSQDSWVSLILTIKKVLVCCLSFVVGGLVGRLHVK